MQAAEGGPPRFKCPPDFSVSPFCPRPPFSQEALQHPSKELWLIRTPAGFSPESLDGRSVPLLGFQTLKAPQPGGTEKIFHIQTALEHLGGARLLLPSGGGDRLTCSPHFSGSLSICERYGDPGSDRPLFPVVARPAPRIPAGLKQRFLPFGNHLERAPLPGAAEEPPRKKKKKKKKQQHWPAEEDSKDQLPLLGMPLGEATGAGEAEARGRHEVDGAALVAVGSQPASVAQDGVLFSGEPEGLAPLSKRAKKKKRKGDRERREEETGGEAEPSCPHGGDGTALSATDPQPSPVADAPNGLLSGGAEEPGPSSKKRKKKRKDGREAQEEVGGEVEAPRQPQEDGPAWWAVSPSPGAQPNSATFNHDALPSGEAEAATPRSRKKKKRKEGGEPKEEAGSQAGAASLHQADGATLWAMGSLANPAATAQDGLLPGQPEDLAPLSKRKKAKKEGRAAEEETEAARPPKEVSAQMSPRDVAHDSLLSGETEEPASIRKKKKRRRRTKEGQEMEEEAGGEAEGLLDLSSCLGGDSAPWAGEDSLLGVEGGTPGTHKGEGQSREKAPPPGPFSSQEDTPGALWAFRGSGPVPEGGVVLAEEEEGSGAGGSSHKAKKKKRKKEKEKPEEAAQEREGWPAQQGAESWAELGAPLGGGGRGGRRRQQAVEGGLAGLQKEVGHS